MADCIQQMLEDMSRFGKPRMGQYGDRGRWRCSVDLSISIPGVSSEVASDWVGDPMTAVSQCHERLHGMVGQVQEAMGGSKGKALEPSR